jgi:hypothetical protein
MSDTHSTTPSSFIRSTSSSDVYFLQSGAARLVPDAATFNYMAQGEAVRTLSDTDFQAIPKGAALPSRADGTILNALVPAGTRLLQAFLMQNGLKRAIPDTATLSGLEKTFGQPHVAAAADLNAIPAGVGMPSRADGTVYQGSGAAFAYVLTNGAKSAVPDATTLRDAGHDPSSALPISAQDLASIPDGAAMPSTSRFLHPPSAAVPLLLLPVRLETRFQGSELWLRVYPDDVHINSFEPDLTADESAARTAYLSAKANGTQAAQSAFAAVARQYGAVRAGWIASASAQSGTKVAQWTRAPFTNVLPERWIVIGYPSTTGPGQVLFVGSPIPETLAVGPDPNGPGLTTDDGMRWIADFTRAIQVGMACKIPLTGAQTRGFARIVVLGLKSNLTPAQAVARLSDLVQAHHYTNGVELLPHAAPTNNTPDAPSAFSPHDPTFTALFALEQGPALCPARPTADGDRLARALGLGPSLLAHIKGADGGQDEAATAINTVMWPTTWGYFLEQVVAGAVPSPDTLLPLARDHYASHVRARGHFPILRIGRQPYGVLPVCWSSQWKPLDGGPLEAPLMSLLAKMRPTWEGSVANVPQLHGAADPEASLVSLLAMAPSSTSWTARNLIGPEYNLTYWRFVQQDPGQAWWTSLAAKSLAQVGDLSSVMASTRLANSTFIDNHRLLSKILVAPPPLDGLAAPNYVRQLANSGWQQLRDFPVGATQPAPLLLLLLRHAALREYLDTATQLLAQSGSVQPTERVEPELLGLSAGLPRPTAWDLLQRPYANKGPVGTYLDSSKQDPAQPAFAGFWSALTRLGTLSSTDLDFLAREVIDLASYRLDAWLTSLAYLRLDQSRTIAPEGGIVLGGYGWLEDVRPQAAMASAGYIHAPSLAHSTTAAVLRSAYLTHQGASPSPLQIDLSSDRVRLGLHLVDGLREGQPLGALLGYRLERSMHDAGLDPLIATLRGIASLNNPDPGTAPAESVAANNVVDGLALLRKIFTNGRLEAGFGLPTDTTTRSQLTSLLQNLTDALDSVADLTLAESVHQLLRGNMVRAGATLDALARGDAPPPELEVVQTPRAGTGVTHRLLAVASAADPAGWTKTARARAEPRLNAWAGAMFGNPSRVHVRASFARGTGAAVPVEFGLDRLGIAPLDLLALPESSSIAGELANRLVRAAAAARPASVPASAVVTLIEERNPSWTVDVLSVREFLELVWKVSRVVAGARAMAPQDLTAPGASPGSIDTQDLQTRAENAETLLRSTYTGLTGTSGLDQHLLAATNFGVPNVFPAQDAAQWRAQASTAASAVEARMTALDTLAKEFARNGASDDARRVHDTARLNAIFGDNFLILPALDSAYTAGWTQLWAGSSSLQGGDPLAANTWFQRMARLRPGVSRLDAALLYAEALAGASLGHFDVAQLPATGGDRWLALSRTGATPSGRLSLVAFAPQSIAAGTPVAGLTIDEWVEVLPDAQQITGISLHHDDPTARAPQALLLGVRPDDFPEWTLESVEGTVLEALDLAKLRAVDTDALSGLGHYLPALYFAYNTGGPQVDAVSTDFNVARAPVAMRNG